MEGKRFQIRTDSKIDNNNDIRWTMRGASWFTLLAQKSNALYCNGGYRLGGNEGFLKRAGVLTFLKTATQVQVWFDDVLAVTWVYEDDKPTRKCSMRQKMEGLKFKSTKKDTVSTHYRYAIGNGHYTNPLPLTVCDIEVMMYYFQRLN